MANKTTKVNETKQVRSLSAENTLYSSVARNTGWRTVSELGLADALSVDAAKAEVLAQIASGYYNKAAVDAMFSLVNTAEFRGPYESTVFIPKPYDTNDLYLVGTEPPYKIFVYIRADDELKEIGGTRVDLSEYAKKEWVEDKNYQPMLTAGAGISISNNIISIVSDSFVSDVLVDGTSVVSSGVASIDLSSYAKTADHYTKEEDDALLDEKLDKVATAGLKVYAQEGIAQSTINVGSEDGQIPIRDENGGLQVPTEPSGDNSAVAKKYVDDSIGEIETPNTGMPLTVTRVKDYFYEADYNELDYNHAMEYLAEDVDGIGACSAIRSGNFYGRNLDWKYDETAEFLVRTPHIGGRRASISICGGISALTEEFVRSGAKSDLYRILPFRVYDGINESGVVASVNVVPQDKGSNRASAAVRTEKTLSVLMLIRFVLDNFDSARAAAEYIRDYVDVFFPEALTDMGYEAHFMLADESATFSLEFIDNATVMTAMPLPYMTNFYLHGVTLNSDNTVNTPADVPTHLPSSNGITDHGQGLERYNIIADSYSTASSAAGMRNLLNNLKYTKTYAQDTTWYSEFAGINNLTVNDPVSAYADTVAAAQEEFSRRTRDGVTWHTVHSSVYNIVDRTLSVIAQEDGESMSYSIPNEHSSSSVEGLAQEYDPTKTYGSTNQKVAIYEGKLYVLKDTSRSVTGQWDSTKWEEFTLAENAVSFYKNANVSNIDVDKKLNYKLYGISGGAYKNAELLFDKTNFQVRIGQNYYGKVAINEESAALTLNKNNTNMIISVSDPQHNGNLRAQVTKDYLPYMAVDPADICVKAYVDEQITELKNLLGI